MRMLPISVTRRDEGGQATVVYVEDIKQVRATADGTCIWLTNAPDLWVTDTVSTVLTAMRTERNIFLAALAGTAP